MTGREGADGLMVGVPLRGSPAHGCATPETAKHRNDSSISYGLIRIVVRRWYVAVGVLALKLLIGIQVVNSVESKYRASGSVVLLRYDPDGRPIRSCTKS